MLYSIIATGLLLLGFIAADWIQLNGFAYIIGIVWLVFFTPALVREIIKLVRK